MDSEYLTMPLKYIPFETLANYEFYIQTDGQYSLYRSHDVELKISDYNRLKKIGVKYIYFSIACKEEYHRLMETALPFIVKDPDMSDERKAEFLYSSSLAVSENLIATPDSEENIKRSENLAKSTVKLILNCKSSFAMLMNMCCNDFYTATHSVNVTILLISVARHVGIRDEEVLGNIGLGGMLQDVGMTYLPPEIIEKRGNLNDEEMEIFKQHVVYTYKHLNKIGVYNAVAVDVATMHHECLDGSGYPRGLKNNQMSLTGKIASVVNMYVSMNTVQLDRKEQSTIQEIIEYFHNHKRKYDQNIVDILEEVVTLKDTHEEDSEGGDLYHYDHEIYDDRLFSSESQRLYKRRNFRKMLEVRTISRKPGQKPELGHPGKYIVYDGSVSGAALLCPTRLAIGSELCISFPVIGSSKFQNIIGKVVRCERQEAGLFAIGVSFYVTQNKQFFEMLKQF